MPELPEVETALRGISPYLKSFIIEKIIVRQPKLRWAVSPELMELSNVKILTLSRRAKYLIIHTENGYIIGHLGMSGSVRIVPHNSPIDKHDHVDIVMSNGKLLRYNDPRRFGAWLWTKNLDEFHLFLKLGPEPLSDEFNAEYLFKKSRKKLTALKTFLMDNSIVVGVGNIYANESLFLCGLHPQKVTANLTQKQCILLVDTIKSVLAKAIQQGGTTLKDFLQPDGRPGYFAQELLVYGNKGKPCPKCGTKIESLVIGQRNSYICPHCQKKK
ncbi:bifunctional DNA-formamidopyrimidine glycosylase/DNA-(apurinic or apyrimidinic site) lyase [Rodentibacter pneumotropicus]|uniref:bifunctional DNA-formamidopyrimidine glycosylase/DNA-(apurinic or apyrimidinic site) lyase n=1 Tax=Rodentibacter pneumotropicus TaxID=758 RepID=UPI000381B60E|nr:bifunctional DNA-formamidopyrimidine glycosylase/DNA-(apurinic or apyrimidinic site) lyase [Rodentibacter pneumotropicus]NBH75258.1 bifunctional DNA-formamidopyrimidine glycosylase/DNA-(apurinic or apyrimidinic site) lyase [Rodentibacter pneumotropicus]OOF63238.1 DNA-formamidopyrimidine glycosylase [Rodentibacter pneumotropicus]THA07987.1 bifunctional DNA-formamidopyrimidine glycosylase/DNA-(apurinic or apyrimidinic site) lyase [Rodentibacter pneumotropicus]THA13069.1 bifunctional DNA-formam